MHVMSGKRLRRRIAGTARRMFGVWFRSASKQPSDTPTVLQRISVIRRSDRCFHRVIPARRVVAHDAQG
jgi:hypothetical protein